MRTINQGKSLQAKNDAATERAFSSNLESMPDQIVHKVQIGVFSIRRPKFWADDVAIIRVTKVIKLTIVMLWLLTIASIVFMTWENDKKNEWRLHTYDQDGNVEQVIEMKKIR